jgi:glucuronate isomerase
MTVLSDNALQIFEPLASLPILSPHGHTSPRWFSENQPFSDPADLLIVPDHYVFRMLYSHGVSLGDLGIGVPVSQRDPRKIFRIFAQHWHLFLGTPSRQWLDDTFRNVFAITQPFSIQTADTVYDTIDAALKTSEFCPRALLDRFNIDFLATTDSALDDLHEHAGFAAVGHRTRLVPTFRPDTVLNPSAAGFVADVHALGALTGENCARVTGYLAALGQRRAAFRAAGACATDHDVPDLATGVLDKATVQEFLDQALSGTISTANATRFYNHMLIEMARMSVDDGLVMQIHAGCQRSTNRHVVAAYGRDTGSDVPKSINWVKGLDGLLDQVGNDPRMGLIVFTLDESTYARELAPMAGHWPALKLGPPWWFHDSPAGIARYFDRVIESAGYFNLAGFNDDTRALLSIPARHEMWRKAVAGHLSQQVAAGRFTMADAHDLAQWLTVDAVKSAYRLDGL